jgi:hypothetical protein
VVSLIGGYRGFIRLQQCTRLIVIVVLTITLVLVYQQSAHFELLINNLHQLAVANKLPVNYYLGALPLLTWLYIISTSIVAISGLAVLRYKFNLLRLALPKISQVSINLLVVLLLFATGIISIATTANTVVLKGKQIVTYQTQLNDGEIAYVVKTISDNSNQGQVAMGILPLQMHNDGLNVIPDSYNYTVAGLLTLKHYLPASISFIIIISLMALFITTLVNYLLSSSRVVVEDIASYFIESKELILQETGKLWLARITIVLTGLLGMAIAFILQSVNFDLVNLLWFIFMVFLLPLVAIKSICYGVYCLYGKK